VTATSQTPSSNPQVNPKYACFRLKIAPSKIHRWGMYAGEKIPKGRKIIEYTGEKCSRRETKIRAEREFNYLFTLDSYWTIDGSVGGSGAEYINHCCAPNVESRIVKGHVLYFAMRDIKTGEELTLDYRFGADVEKHNCACGAKECRGTINLAPEPKKPRKKKPAA
jgi:uncharacterized protein